jgi:hypothetical protein
MAQAKNKTAPDGGSVDAFIDGVEDAGRREDCRRLLKLMRQVTGEKAEMWGASIVGFGRYRYRYESGREGDWFLTGFSPRKQALTLYIMAGFSRYDEMLAALGKHKTGKSCLYLKRLDDADQDVLRELIAASADHVRKSSVA